MDSAEYRTGGDAAMTEKEIRPQRGNADRAEDGGEVEDYSRSPLLQKMKHS